MPKLTADELDDRSIQDQNGLQTIRISSDKVGRSVEALAERHKTIILLRLSTIPKPPKGARGQRRGSLGPHLGPNIFGPSERNKIKILLR